MYSRCEIKTFFFSQAKSDIGGRWTNGQSDVELDYRRDMVGSVHSEARGRGGGGGGAVPPIPSIYQQAAALARREIEISQVRHY